MSESQKAATERPQSEFPFAVAVLDVYDGPLDLLLHLIRQQDIDIHDIPIATITAQFLAYCERMKTLDVDVAAEFIYMASLLIHIKSKMLLPRDPAAPAEELGDPRDELVRRLIEHEKYKNAAQMLHQKQQLEDAATTNPNLKEFREADGAEAEIVADTVDLARAFRIILERAKNRPMVEIDEDAVTVGQMIQFLRRRLMLEDKPIRLKRLLHGVNSRNALVCTFLAMLELVRLQAVLLRQEKMFGEILVKKHEKFDELLGENAIVRDDWK